MTIKEIAKLAGVSSAAVSRYLNGGYVSDEKKEQIKKVIDETGYQPSAQARMLRTKKAWLYQRLIQNPSAGSRQESKRFFRSGITRCCLPERIIHRRRK